MVEPSVHTISCRQDVLGSVIVLDLVDVMGELTMWPGRVIRLFPVYDAARSVAAFIRFWMTRSVDKDTAVNILVRELMVSVSRNTSGR